MPHHAIVAPRRQLDPGHTKRLPLAGCGKRLGDSRKAGETACPTTISQLCQQWWGRRFRLPGLFPQPARVRRVRVHLTVAPPVCHL